jgi:hypothetical protein
MHSVFSSNAMFECREKLKCLLWECYFVVSINNLANQRGFWIKKAIPFYIISKILDYLANQRVFWIKKGIPFYIIRNF